MQTSLGHTPMSGVECRRENPKGVALSIASNASGTTSALNRSMMFNEELLAQIDRSRMPHHIAVIMDGNGRWAKRHSLPRLDGHRAGVDAVDVVVTACRELGIEALTLYAFSTENWNRPAEEVAALMQLLAEYLDKEADRMEREGIGLNTIGRVEDLPSFVQDRLRAVKERTRHNTAMVLTLALSYGSRSEILSATKRLLTDVTAGRADPRDVDEELFSAYLDTASLPECDLLIRTSGELRISNFLLWQLAYTELYFTETLWPDFRGDDLLHAILSFQQRERRYGLTDEQVRPPDR